jgi:hypothetical protein
LNSAVLPQIAANRLQEPQKTNPEARLQRAHRQKLAKGKAVIARRALAR